MPQIKNKIENRQNSWAAYKRFRIGDTCEHQEISYINITGGNGEPGISGDWKKTSSDFTTTEKAKLSGVETGATADQTGTEIVAEIDALLGNTEWKAPRSLEYIQDAVAAMFQLGNHTNISVNYNDTTGAIDLTASGTGGGLSEEEIEDIVGGFAIPGNGINITYDDANNTLTFSLAGEIFTTAYKNNVDANTTHRTATNNPHGVTKSQVGLSNVDNTSDANKPVSTAQQTALNGKEKKRVRKPVTNTTQYTAVASDFTDSELHFTGVPAGSTINVIVNTGVCPNTEPSTGLQIVVHPASKISFSGTASLTPQPGAILTSANDGTSVAIVGLKPTTDANTFGVFGSLEGDGTGTGSGTIYDVFTDSEDGLAPKVLNEPSTSVSNITSTSFDATVTAEGGTLKKLTSEGWMDDIFDRTAVNTSDNGLSIPDSNIIPSYLGLSHDFYYVLGVGTLTWSLKNSNKFGSRKLTVSNFSGNGFTLNTEDNSNDIKDKGVNSNSISIPNNDTWDFISDGNNWIVINKY